MSNDGAGGDVFREDVPARQERANGQGEAVNYQDAIHDYLRLDSGRSMASMWADVERLRRLGCKYPDLPATWQEFQAGLEDLVKAGLAEKLSNGAYLWLPQKRTPVCEPKGDRLLFS